MVRRFESKAAADAAIRAAISAGHCKTGYSNLRYGGGRFGHYYAAHVQDGCASWCLR